jgi:hypothetical protein
MSMLYFIGVGELVGKRKREDVKNGWCEVKIRVLDSRLGNFGYCWW